MSYLISRVFIIITFPENFYNYWFFKRPIYAQYLLSRATNYLRNQNQSKTVVHLTKL